MVSAFLLSFLIFYSLCLLLYDTFTLICINYGFVVFDTMKCA
jgi:hypothetical protein